MDRFIYETSFFYLRSQITDALNKCRFLRPIREVFGLQNTDLDHSEDEMSNAQVSSKLFMIISRNPQTSVQLIYRKSPSKNFNDK